MHPPVTFLRVLAALAGGVLIYASLFLYENEHGALQNRLEVWRVRLAEESRHVPGRQTAFMRGVARLTGAGFDRLFGARLLSWSAAATSVCVSLASLCLIGVLLGVEKGILHSPGGSSWFEGSWFNLGAAGAW